MEARQGDQHLDAHTLAGVHPAADLGGGEQAAVQVLAPDVLDAALPLGGLHPVVDVARVLAVVHLCIEKCILGGLSHAAAPKVFIPRQRLWS